MFLILRHISTAWVSLSWAFFTYRVLFPLFLNHAKRTFIVTLGKRSFPKDILPIYTRDVACIIIQRKWRGILMRQFLRALVRATHDEVWDPVRGRFNYYHREAETLHQEKPRLLGSFRHCLCFLCHIQIRLAMSWKLNAASELLLLHVVGYYLHR